VGCASRAMGASLGHSDVAVEQLVILARDYAGQHEHLDMHRCLFTRQALYLVVFDLSEDTRGSATRAIQWICDLEDRLAGAVFALVGTRYHERRH
jgi:hypothetical protein